MSLLQIAVPELDHLLLSRDGPVGVEMERIGAVVEAAAKVLCPVSNLPWDSTGELQASITHTVDASTSGPVVRVGTDVEYAVYVEFGAPAINQTGTPFLRPALHAAKI